MARTDRDRLIELRRGLDLRDRLGPAQTQRQLVRVYDGGAIPTSVPKVFLTHPAVADAADTEGASYGTSDNTGVTIPVVVLGPKVPVAGDLLMAHAIGGRWLAGDGGHVNVCGPFCTACGGRHLQGGSITDTLGAHELKANNAPSFGAGGLWTDAISYSVPDPPGCVVCTDPRTGNAGPGIYWWNIGCFGGAIIASVYWGVLNAADPRFYNPQCFATFTINGNPLIGECTIVSNGNSVAPTCGDQITGSGTNTWSTPGLFFNSPPASGAFSFSLNTEEPGSVLCCAPCPIPKADLTLTAVRLSDGATTTSTIAWDLAAVDWHTSDDPPYDATLKCVSGTVQLKTAAGAETEVLVAEDTVCSPLHLHFRNPGYPTAGFDYYVDV